MDRPRNSGSMSGDYGNPLQPGDGYDFWSRPPEPAQEPEREPVASPFTEQEQQQQPEPQPQQAPPQQNEELLRVQRELEQMRAAQENQRAEQEARRVREQWRNDRRAALDESFSQIDAQQDLDDDQKQALKRVAQQQYDRLNSTVDTQFQQYDGQVKQWAQQREAPAYVMQRFMQEGIPLPFATALLQKGLASEHNIDTAMPTFKQMAAEYQQANQNLAAQTNQQQIESGMGNVAGHGDSAPASRQVEVGSDEHLEQLLVGF